VICAAEKCKSRDARVDRGRRRDSGHFRTGATNFARSRAANRRTAKQANPSIVDSVSSFCARHTTPCKTPGGAALSIALAKVAQRTRQA
jgi:hypothetical protein